jgi:hypothetical protein
MKCEDFWLEHQLTRDDVFGALLAFAICLGAGVIAATCFDLIDRGTQPHVRAAYALGPTRQAQFSADTKLGGVVVTQELLKPWLVGSN